MSDFEWVPRREAELVERGLSKERAHQLAWREWQKHVRRELRSLKAANVRPASTLKPLIVPDDE